MLAVMRRVLPLHRIEGVFTMRYLRKDRVIVWAHERWVTTEKDVKDHTDTPDVRS